MRLLLFRQLKFLFSLIAVILLISCPEPLNQRLLAEVEDLVSPSISIASPNLSVQNFISSQVTIVGTIRDYSDNDGIILGGIESATYADKYGFLGISDSITIESDGSFGISFSSVTLLDTFTIVLTVTDWNSNVSSKEITYWKDDTGPYITVVQPDLSEQNYYSSALTSMIDITGQVGTDVQIFTYDVEWSGTNSTGNPIVWDGTTGTYSISSDQSGLGYSGSLTFWLKAKDAELNTTNKLFIFYDDPIAPDITGAGILSSDNATISIEFDDNVYSGADGSGVLDISDFILDFSANSGSATGASITGFASTLSEGDESFILNIFVAGGSVSGLETVILRAAPNSIYDRTGNPSTFTTITEGIINLKDKERPVVESVTQESLTTVNVVFSESVDEDQANTLSYYSTNGNYPNNIELVGVTATLTFDLLDIGTQLNIDGSSINDLAGNPLAAISNRDIIDGVEPEILSINSSVIGSGPFNLVEDFYIDVAFTESVTLTGEASLTLNSGGVATLNGGSGSTLSFYYDIQSGESESDLTVLDFTGGSIVDDSPNSNLLNRSLPAGNNLGDIRDIAIDGVPPTIAVNKVSGQDDPTNVNSAQFQFEFSEAINVSSFIEADIEITGTSGSITSGLNLVSGNTFTITVTGMTSGDIATISLPAGRVQDLAGNDNITSMSTDNTVAYDNVKPDVSINEHSDQDDPTNMDSAKFIISFTEEIDVSSFESSDIDISGTLGSITGEPVSAGGNDYEITVTGMSSGDVVAVVIPAGEVTDLAGNSNTVSSFTDNQVTYDNTKPDVTIDVKSGQSDPIHTDSVIYEIVFTEPIFNFDSTDINISGASPGSIISEPTHTGINNIYEITISDLTHNDTVIAEISSGKVNDLAGNLNTVSTSDDNSVKYEDNTKPTLLSVNIEDSSPSSPGTGNGDTITFTFDEPINPASISSMSDNDPNSLIGRLGVVDVETGVASGEDGSSITVSGNDIIITLGGLNSSNISDTPPSGSFAPLDTLEDFAGNGANTTSSIVSGSWDETAPVVNSYSVNPSAVTISGTTITIDITYSEEMDQTVDPTLGFSDHGAAVITSQSGVWDSATVYRATSIVSGALTGLWNVDVTVNNGKDIVGNNQTSFSDLDNFTINIAF